MIDYKCIHINSYLPLILLPPSFLFPSLEPPALPFPSLLPSSCSSLTTNTTHSPPCSSIQCESIKHNKLPGASHMVSDTSTCRREGGVPDTHSTVLKWDNSPAIPTGGQCDSTDGGDSPWNGVPGDCVCLQSGWNQYN